MSIPKRIHYCWLSNDPIPGFMQQYIEGWKRLLPEYEFIKWDLNRFDQTVSPWVREAVEHKKYTFACDYIRIFAVYHYGGIYLDMDVELLKAPDELLNRPRLFAYETPDESRIEAACFGAQKEDPFLEACLAYYEGRHFVDQNGILDTVPLSKVMYQVMQKHRIKMDILSWEYFTAKSYATGIESPGAHTYAIHHFAGSWKSEKERNTIETARRIRKAHPIVGKYPAFVYEKMTKVLEILKTGRIRELCVRIRQYIRNNH